jgi:hypothetical protein
MVDGLVIALADEADFRDSGVAGLFGMSLEAASDAGI